MSNIVKIRDRGVTIDLVLSSECYIDVNGTTVFGKSPNNVSLTPKFQLTKRAAHEDTSKGSKAYLEAEEFVKTFESRFDTEFLQRFWNVVMEKMRFMNVVYRADYLKMLPPDKPTEAMMQSTKKFLISGFPEQNQENVGSVRNMFMAYMQNCDRFYQKDQKPVVMQPTKNTERWSNRAKEVN